MNLAQHSETTTRALLADRSSTLLLDLWECAEVIRDEFVRAGNALGHEAAANVIGWTIDELSSRFPSVIPRWYGLAEGGINADLATLFRGEL